MPGKKNHSLLPAYGLITALISFITLTNSSLSQEYSPLDSIKVGSNYKLIMFDESEIIGKVISIDSVYIKIDKGRQVLSIRKDDIYDVSKNLTPSKYRFMFSTGGGISFPAAELVGVTNRDYKHSYTFQLNGGYLFKPGKAIRLDFGYSRLKRKLTESWGDIAIEGGTADMFSMKGDLLVGELRPKFNIYAYAFVGLGLHYINLDETIITQYMNYDSTYHTYRYEAVNEFNAVFCVGGGAGYRLTKSLGIYTEIQYTMASNKSSNIFGYDGGYIPVRFGLTYFIY
jgi:hypothetical protein